jgi:outer membrane receptor protein involved in Fe transport
LPNFQIASPWYAVSVSGVGVNNSSNPISAEEGLNWVHGKHALKFGFQVLREVFQNVGRGQHYAFSNAQTGNPQEVGSTGASLASALLGLPSSISDTEGVYTEGLNIWGAYLQDTWKISPKLTVVYGLRYDQFPSPHYTRGGTTSLT